MSREEGEKMQTFGEKLKEARKSKKLTQKELAEKCEVKTNVFGHYENDRNYPTVEVLKKICTELDISADWLLDIPDKKTKENIPLTIKEQAINEMMTYCEENKINKFHELVDYCRKNNNEKFKYICNEDIAKIMVEFIKSEN